VGRTLDVLVDAIADGVAIARSTADAPEIDGLVHVVDGGDLAPGQFARVHITSADAHDLHGKVASSS
jgi:ribosomal protein S12 methylthiotransferase